MTFYRPEIDGLRTVAVIAVILFHLNSNILIGGYYGVDVFFVISGYLITGILTKSILKGNFSMLNFWIKRVKRLIPLLLVVIICTIVFSSFFLFKPTFSESLRDVFPAIFSYFNFHAYFNFGDYWGPTAENSLFLHTWSLAIEEQFYLIYPFFLFIIHKIFKNFLNTLILVTLISLGLFLYYSNVNSQLAFYMLPFRMWELSLGGVIACITTQNSHLIRSNVFSIFGFSLIIVSFFFAKTGLSYLAILPVVGTALIIYFSSGKDLLGQILSTKIFVHFGKLSYALYLWHWPVFVIYKQLSYKFIHIDKLYIYAFLLLITYVLSYFSNKLIETRFRNNAKTPKLIIVGIGICFMLYSFYTSSLFNIHYPSKFNQQTIYGLRYDVNPTQDIIEKDNPRFFNTIVIKRPTKDQDAYKNEGITQKSHNKKPEILILGDSHGAAWVKSIFKVSKDLEVSSSAFTTNATKPFFNIKSIENQEENNYFNKQQRIDYAQALVNNINDWKIKVLIISCRWENLTPKNKADFEELIQYLNQRNIKMLVLNQPPCLTILGDNNANQFFSFLNIEPKNGFNTMVINQNHILKSNNYLKQISNKYNNVVLFDVFKKLYLNGEVKITYKNEALYFDDDHLSTKGTELFEEDLSKILKIILKK
ncbi:MAG: acyltransferase [Fluviicola sp.]|nr:acyltransferase [Fluviicola sp.]